MPILVVVVGSKDGVNDAEVARGVHGVGDLLKVEGKVALTTLSFVETRSTLMYYYTSRTIP